MSKQNTLEAVNICMREMKEKKAAELTEIQEKQIDASTDLMKATQAMKEATERMDLDAYERAKDAQCRAQTAIDMYSGRYTQISQQEYISEAESDKVIDGLLAYEDQLAEDFKAAVADPLKKLAEMCNAYRAAVAATERTLTEWQQDIHANYNTRGRTSHYDKEANTWTNRSESPVPVHVTPYTGCKEYHIMQEYLDTSVALYEG